MYNNFFETIDTEEKAYWLGFIAADGCVRNDELVMTIELKRNDKQHLEKFKQCVDETSKIYDTIHNEKYESSGIRIYSKKCCEDLNRLGITPRKSLTLKINKELIPESLYSHLIRGYFDGDGSIFCSNPNRIKDYSYDEWGINFVGTKDTMLFIKNFLQVNNKICNKCNIFSLDINGTFKAYECLCKLYQNATIYLDRKYNKFLELSSSQRLNRLVSRRDYFAEEKLTSPLVGFILGGASIRNLQVVKNSRKIDKLLIVQNIFEEYGYKTELSETSGLKIRISPEVRAIYQHKFYPNGNKTITRSLLNELNNDALFIWFFLNSRAVDSGIELSTACFSLEENQIIQKYFKVVHNYDLHIRRHKNTYTLYMPNKYKEEFLNKVYAPKGIVT